MTVTATDPLTGNPAQALRTALLRQAKPGGAWYAVLDAAQDAESPQRARDTGLRTQSLYAGELGARVDHVAPHLATFDPQGAFADWLFEHWSGNHGILLQSQADCPELRRHFRNFLLVRDQAGRRYRFRFYDPRILRAFLPACTPAEAKEFFGPVTSFYAADRFARSVMVFSMGTKGLLIETGGR
jgi:hypothetical protein